MIEATLKLQRGAFTLDVALQLPERGVSVLFGPSGCGKTTVLRALAGLERASGRVALGTAVWQDDVAGVFLPTHRRALGYVIQEAALFPHLTVQGNLDYGRKRSGRAAGDDGAVIELLGIAGLMQRRPVTLSGGERQRVAIARALAAQPRLLLMDEPLAALDAARKAEILPYLERLHRELALPIVYVTHAPDEVARLADHLVLLQEGRVQAAGPLAEVLARSDLPVGALGRPDDAGVVIEAEVTERDTAYGLSRISFDGGALWVGDTPLGRRVRARVLARDVSVARQPPLESSVVNVLPVTLDSLLTEGHTALLRLRVGVGVGVGEGVGVGTGPLLLSRITRKSCDALALRPGDRLYAQVKGVALM